MGVFDFNFEYEHDPDQDNNPLRELPRGERVFARHLIARCSDPDLKARVSPDVVRLICGLDVGSPDPGGDLCVLTVVSQRRGAGARPFVRELNVESITAFPRGSSHTDVAEAVARQMDSLYIEGKADRDVLLCVDANGVGASMPELIRSRSEYLPGHPFRTTPTQRGEHDAHPFGEGRIHIIPTKWMGKFPSSKRGVLAPSKASVLSMMHTLMKEGGLRWPASMEGLNDLQFELGRVLKTSEEGDYPTFVRSSTDHMASLAMAVYLACRLGRADTEVGKYASKHSTWELVHAVTNLVLYGSMDDSTFTAELVASDRKPFRMQ